MKLLSELQPGAQARIVGVNASRQIAQQLMVMGLLPGVTIDVVGVAPLGDPMTVKIQGRSITLRRNDAALVEIE